MKSIFCILVIVLPFISRAQINLVKNPGFEAYFRCPNDINQINFANYWSPIHDTISFSWDSIGESADCAPEYCNVCSSGSGVSVPIGGWYYHYTHSGNGMSQVVMYSDMSNLDTGYASFLRDYLQGRLYSHLVAGQSYCVSFFVSLEPLSAWAVNHIGAYFDDGSIDTVTWCGWPHPFAIPQVVTDSIINGVETDSINWQKIEGSFIATGTEKFITIGNFYDSAHTSKLWTGFLAAVSGVNTIFSWYLVDDVSVIATDAVALAGYDTTVPTTYIDSVQVGDTTGYLPCYWYKRIYSSGTWVLIDSNTAGFKVHPDSSTWYKMELTVCGHTTTDSMKITVGNVDASIVQFAGLCTFPNPASKEFNIEGIKNYSVRVIDIVGREVIAYTHVAGNLKIPVGELERGMYFVELTDEETGVRVVRKLVKS